MFVRVVCGLSLTFVLLCGCGDGPEKIGMHPLDEFEERNDDPLAAAAHRYYQRLSADGTVPERAMMRAKGQRDLVVQRRMANMANGTAGGVWPLTWQWVGPGNIGGRLRPVVIHPTIPNIVYVGSASGGIWKTTDGGQNWFALDDFLASLSVGDMVMHPEDPNTLYAGTGEGFFETQEGSSNTAAVRGAGIFISTDAGRTWNQIPSTDNANFYFVNRLEFDPSNSSTLLAATNTGIWRSTDGGTTWTLRESFHALDVKFNPNDPLKVVAGGHDTADGPYFSNDGGVTWTLATGAGGDRQEIAWAPSQPNTVYAAVSDDFEIKVWRSADGGQNYTLQTSGSGLQTWAGYNNTIWVDPGDPDFLVVGGVNLFRSTNGGVNFSQRFNVVHADMHRIVQHPAFDGTTNKSVYFACDGGIWRTDDVYGNDAIDLNNNLGVTQFYGGGINPTTGDIIGGTQDNGTLFFSGDPQNWDHIFGGDGGYGASDPTNSSYFYGEVQWAFLHRSSNGGQSSGYIFSGPNPIEDAGSSSTTNFIPFFMLDPNDPNRMLVACARMWLSENVKDPQPDWFPIKDSIAPEGRFLADNSIAPEGRFLADKKLGAHFSPNSPYHLSTIAVAEGNSDIIWAAHNNGDLYFSSNGTDAKRTWTRVDENGIGLPDRWISTVVIDRHNHEHVYVAFMGWENDNLWETVDSGNSWTDISGASPESIPDAPISALAVHRNLPGWLYAGTDVGVFTSANNGVTWTTQSAGPGTVPVEQLLWKNDNTLLAVTHGRGMFLGAETSVLPERFRLPAGVQVAGELSDIFTSDNQYLELDPSPTNNLLRQRVNLIVRSTSSTAAPTDFQFRLESRMLGGPTGDVIQTIKLRNYSTGRFELVDTRPAVAVNDESVRVQPTGNLSRFVQAGTKAITASVTWNSTSFTGPQFNWSIDVDEAVWLVIE
jgi:photosystem II stability/assembly factor-like uncharacterized protein